MHALMHCMRLTDDKPTFLQMRNMQGCETLPKLNKTQNGTALLKHKNMREDLNGILCAM